MNMVKQMPRLLDKAGLVPIKLKRKKEYRSAEKSERIRPEIILTQYLCDTHTFQFGI